MLCSWSTKLTYETCLSHRIYAFSIFPTKDIPDPTAFHSILSVDTQKEAGLDPSRVHVVTSASKDWAVNGFRIGVLISQSNKDLMRAMISLGMIAQMSSPAAALWYTLINDAPFRDWYVKENRRRLSASYEYIVDWASHHKVPYVPSNAGHFVMLDFRQFLRDFTPEGSKDDDDESARKAEGALLMHLLEHRVFLGPGAQYHHPQPGWFRLTFSQEPSSIREGLKRVESVLKLESHIQHQPLPDLAAGGPPAPRPQVSVSTFVEPQSGSTDQSGVYPHSHLQSEKASMGSGYGAESTLLRSELQEQEMKKKKGNKKRGWLCGLF